jgi:hypothetical protein
MSVSQNFILLIFNCEKYRHKALKQKDTWLKKIPDYLAYYHVLSIIPNKNDDDTTNNNNDDYIFDHDNHILRVNTPDDYNSLPKKVYAAYNAINATFSYKYIFKTDDDQMVTNMQIFDLIVRMIAKENALNRTVHYGGYLVDIQIPHISKYCLIHEELPTNLLMKATKYCSGRFYLLSSQAITYLLGKKEEICSEYFEDYAVGYHLDAVKFKAHILRINTNQFFVDMGAT